MADKTIGQLPVSAGLDDNSLLVMEQGGEARSITGALVKKFAKDAVAEDVSRAEQAAKDASEAKTSVDTAKTAIDQAKTDIDQTKAAIDGIKTDIDTAKTAIDQAQADIAQDKTDAEAAADAASTSASAAEENAGLVAAALEEADGIVEEVTELRNEALNTVKSAVLFTEQQLTDAQKEQAKANIGAPYDKGPSCTVKWNGATSNLVSFTVNESAELNYVGETYYLMPRTSSKVPSAASLEALGGSYTYQTGRDHMDKELGMVVPAVATVAFGAGNGNLDSDSYPGATIVGDMVIVVHEIDTPLYDITVEKPGVYFRKYWQSPNFYQTQVTEMTLTGGVLDDGLERLPEKFLPENVLKYTAQSLTDTEKKQARANIAAPGKVVDGGELFNAALLASGSNSHAEGNKTRASAPAAHAEGNNTWATGTYSHAEGDTTTASGKAAHAEGYQSQANGDYSHAQGRSCTADGNHSHAEGYESRATGDQSHAEGKGTVAAGNNQHVQGKNNIEDTANRYAHIVGNGTTERSNAHTLDWDGNAWFKGKVLVGGTGQDDGKELGTWEAMPDKPTIFEGGDTLTWDGDTTGLVSAGGMFYKVSDAVPTLEDFASGAIVTADGMENMPFPAEYFVEAMPGVIMGVEGAFLSVSQSAVGVDLDGIVFGEVGTYIKNIGESYFSLTIPGYTGFGKEVIDPDYLPESVKGGSGGVVYVECSSEDLVTFTFDKTFDEVKALYEAGADVRVRFNMDGEIYICGLAYYYEPEEFVFSSVSNGAMGAVLATALLSNDSTKNKFEIAFLQLVTS